MVHSGGCEYCHTHRFGSTVCWISKHLQISCSVAARQSLGQDSDSSLWMQNQMLSLLSCHTVSL